MYLRIKNGHNAAMRLDATVKCIEVVENRSFQTNRLIFGLRSTVMIIKIVHIFNCCCTIVCAPSSRPSNPDCFFRSVKQIRVFSIVVTSLIFGRVNNRLDVLSLHANSGDGCWLIKSGTLAKTLLNSVDFDTFTVIQLRCTANSFSSSYYFHSACHAHLIPVAVLPAAKQAGIISVSSLPRINGALLYNSTC